MSYQSPEQHQHDWFHRVPHHHYFSAEPSPTTTSSAAAALFCPGTPKMCNKKRPVLLLDASADDDEPESDASLSLSSSSSSSCSFEQLQRSLKRVRLSSDSIQSPGELRLQRDLRHAAALSWTAVGEDEWRVQAVPSQGVNNSTNPANHNCRETLEVTVTRPDIMELVLRIVQQTTTQSEENSASHTTTTTTTKLYLSFPRRYPHQPPTVRRMECQQQSTTASSSSAENQPRHVDPHEPRTCSSGTSTSASSCFGSGSNSSNRSFPMHNLSEGAREGLQRILIPACPVEAAGIVATPGTVVLTDWSPVHRLNDVCDWLIATVLRHSRHGRSQQQRPVRQLSIQCPSFSNSSRAGSSDDGQSTPVHRNGALLTTTTTSSTTASLSSMETSDDSSTTTNATYNWETAAAAAAPRNPQLDLAAGRSNDNVDYERDSVGDFPMATTTTAAPFHRSNNSSNPPPVDINGEHFLAPGRFHVGYDQEPDTAVTMMMDL